MEKTTEFIPQKKWGNIKQGLRLNYFKLYEDQEPVFSKTRDFIISGKNGLIKAFTAFGKTIIAIRAAGAVCIREVQVSQPDGSIITRTGRGMYLYDENEGLLQAAGKFRIAFPPELKIAHFFGGAKDIVTDTDDTAIMIASYQSLNNSRMQEKLYKNFGKYYFDFLIVNEAHESMAPTYRKVLDYFQCPKIGMTATPKREDGQNIMEIYDELICDLPIEEAIVRGRVCPIEYHIMGSNLSKKVLEQMVEDVADGKRISMKQINEQIFIENMDIEIARIIQEYANPIGLEPRQVKIFCEKIEHADNFAKYLPVDTTVVYHSEKTKKHNHAALEGFRSKKYQYLLSVNKFNQDIDVPEIEVEVFLRGTNSQIVFWQQLGRGTRKHPLKDKLIVLDFVANAERLIMINQFFEDIQELDREINEGEPLKDKLFIKGSGFDFKFSDLQVKNLLSLIERIKDINRAGWPTEEELKERCIKVFGNFDFSENKYSLRRKVEIGGPSPDSFSRIYNKTFNELFRGRKINEWPTEEELRQGCLEYFGHLDISGKSDYEPVRHKFPGPSVGNFKKIYGKSFTKFFKGKEKDEWPTEEELKTECLLVFKDLNMEISVENYDLLRKQKKHRGPSAGNLKKIYSKTFHEFFTGRAFIKTWPTEEELKTECLQFFGHLNFNTIDYNKAKRAGDISGPLNPDFTKVYGRTFQSFFKGTAKSDYVSEDVLKERCLDMFGTLKIQAKDYNPKRFELGGPLESSFRKYYKKTFKEFFSGTPRGVYWNASELKKKMFDLLGTSFTIAQYHELLNKGLINGPNSSAFKKEYGMSFHEFFRDKKRVINTWPTEEELKQRCFKIFESLKFTTREYDKVCNNKIHGPNSSRIRLVYGKTFSELIRGKKGSRSFKE